MKAMQRQMAFGIGLAAVVSLPAPVLAQYGYQRGRSTRTTDTPELLVGTCHSSPRQLGVDAARQLRDRISSQNSERDLYVIPNKAVNEALTSSGYAADSALSLTDLGLLGKLVHADEIISCEASTTPSGVWLGALMVLSTDVTQTQPLQPTAAANFEDAAKVIEREYSDARKQLDGYTKCRDELRDGKPRDAIGHARDAINKYSRSTLARICLANAYASKAVNFPPDSVLAVTDQILKIDSNNVYAIQLAIGAYDKQGNQAAETDAMLRLYHLQPQDQSLALKIINFLAAQPDAASVRKALAITNDALSRNPGDPSMLQQKWKLLASLKDFPGAVSAGEAMVQSDPTLADSSYFARQVAMSLTDSAWTKVAQFAAQGSEKFPTNPQLPYYGGIALRNLKQYPEAVASLRKAYALDPTNANARLFLAQTYTDLGQADSAVVIADEAIAAGADKAVWGPMLIAPAQEAFTKAQSDTANAIEHFETAYKYAMHADSLAPSKFTKFFAAVSAFQVGVGLYRDLSANQKDKDCAKATRANDLFTTTQLMLPEGGSVDPGTATNILKYLSNLSDVTSQMVKAYCKVKKTP